MAQSPITKTMDEMLAKLKDATQVYREAEKSVAEYTNAIRALATVCEDEEVKADYLLKLEELSGKPGFVDAIRSVLRGHRDALTPKEIRSWITIGKKLDLSSYSNPMASIHTTLRRMKENGEIEEIQGPNGLKAFRLTKRTLTHPLKGLPKLDSR